MPVSLNQVKGHSAVAKAHPRRDGAPQLICTTGKFFRDRTGIRVPILASPLGRPDPQMRAAWLRPAARPHGSS